MFTRPTDLADAEVRAALVRGWGLDVVGIEHAPVGFGSHHWRWRRVADPGGSPPRTTCGCSGARPTSRWQVRSGLFGPMAWRVVVERSDVLSALLDRYAALVAGAGPARAVTTHGEPHRGNTMATASGGVLVDWDTGLLAPPERDLWMLVGEDPGIRDRYAARTGTALDPRLLEAYGCGGTSPTSRPACATFRRRTSTTRTPAPPGPPCAGCSTRHPPRHECGSGRAGGGPSDAGCRGGPRPAYRLAGAAITAPTSR